MRRILFALLFFIGSCTTHQSYTLEVEEFGTVVVCGEFDRSLLMNNEQLQSWYQPRYNDYIVDTTLIPFIQQYANSVHYLIIVGTWCSDSKREIPHLLKILDAAKVSPQRIWLYGVDRTKTSNDGTTQKYRITNVPTIILMKEGKEIGRITEHPEETLEQDIVKILSAAKP